MRLILASSSPYRQELLARLRLPFEAVAADVDETPLPHEPIVDLAARLAALKAETILARHPDALVIGSDQVGTLDGIISIGKPDTVSHALLFGIRSLPWFGKSP